MEEYISFTGHRDKRTSVSVLNDIAKKHPNATWVHGGAVGFDTQVERYAKLHNIKTLVIKPDYEKFKERVKYAPLARDKEIVEKSTCLYACYDGRDHGGTKFTVEYARKIGKSVIILPALD